MESKEQELVELLEAFQRIRQTKDWNILQELFYKRELASIESQLLNEALTSKIEDPRIYRLQGEWQRVRLYDADRVIERLTAELKGIKQSNES